MNTFQIVILSVFGFFIVAGLAVLSITKANERAARVSVALWGTASAGDFAKLNEAVLGGRDDFKIFYTEIAEDEFDQKLLEALAVNQGPDAILLSEQQLVRHKNKILPIPYETLTLRQFRDAFIQEGELYLHSSGIFALPLSVDPLVMYWNRNHFDAAGIAAPPRFWDGFLLLPEKLTVKDRAGNIARAAVALGEYRNITHAKELIVALALQSGIEPVAAAGGGYRANLNAPEMRRTIDFYTEFANPSKSVYSWNRSLPESRQAFLAEKVSVYFGFSSELPELRRANPNLNFDMAHFPSLRGAAVPVTYGRMLGVAALRSARASAGAIEAALLLSSPAAAAAWSSITGLPPVRRELLSARPSDAYSAILYDSALRARGFLDPHKAPSHRVLQDMIESITSGRRRSGDALSQAQAGLERLLR